MVCGPVLPRRPRMVAGSSPIGVSSAGLEETAAWETAQLADLGLGPEAIVDELLAIAVEMWRDVGRRDA